MNGALFEDRRDAGLQLADELAEAGLASPHLLAVPAGGVAVAVPIAQRTGWPLSLMIVRKIQLPWNTEAGFGALTADGDIIVNEEMVGGLRLSQEQVNAQIDKTADELARRRERFAVALPPPTLQGSTAVLIDDGLASGLTMVAAIQSARKLGPDSVVVAVPVAHEGAAKRVSEQADSVVALYVVHGYAFAVASFYRHWHDLSDAEVEDLLRDLRESEGDRAAGRS